jgi:peptide/nickel transport system substrate-binding protein
MAKQIDDMISLDPAESFEFSGSEVVGNIYERLISYDLKDVEARRASWPRAGVGWRRRQDSTPSRCEGRQVRLGQPGNCLDAAYASGP